MGKRIVVLEDNKEILDLMEEILSDEGYHIIGFNHYESVDNIIDFAPKLILIDIRLTDGYGHLLCADLKANPQTSHIPVLLVSGAGNLEKIAHDCNADNFLAKPFNMDDLVNMVKQYI